MNERIKKVSASLLVASATSLALAGCFGQRQGKSSDPKPSTGQSAQEKPSGYNSEDPWGFNDLRDRNTLAANFICGAELRASARHDREVIISFDTYPKDMPFNDTPADHATAANWFIPEEQHMVDEAEKAAVVAEDANIPCFDPRNPTRVPADDTITPFSVELWLSKKYCPKDAEADATRYATQPLDEKPIRFAFSETKRADLVDQSRNIAQMLTEAGIVCDALGEPEIILP